MEKNKWGGEEKENNEKKWKKKYKKKEKKEAKNRLKWSSNSLGMVLFMVN